MLSRTPDILGFDDDGNPRETRVLRDGATICEVGTEGVSPEWEEEGPTTGE